MTTQKRRDPISRIAMIIAPTYVAVRLLTGTWETWAAFGLVFTAVFGLYLVFIVPGLDDGHSPSPRH